VNGNSTGSVDANWGQPLGPEQQQALVEALLAARAAHPGFEALEGVMSSCACALKPDWTKITVTEFIESLWCIVRYSNFCAEVRDAVLLEAANRERAVVEALTPASFIEDQATDTVPGSTASAPGIVEEPAATVSRERMQKQFATFAEARAAVLREHADVDVFMPAMDELAKGLTMKQGEITPAHYLEALLVVTKTANFTAPLRERLLEGAVPASTHRM
jgi:hypothetical protein